MMFLKVFLFTLLIIAGSMNAVKGQVTPEEIQALKEELQKLIAQQELKIAELEELISDMKAQKEQEEAESELQKLLEEAAQMSVREKEKDETLSKRFSSGVRQQQILNPEVSLLGEFYGNVSNSQNDVFDRQNEILNGKNGLFLRGLEVNINAPLDPFTRGKSTISFSEDEIDVELGYMEWLSLPLRSNIRVGKLRPEFGSFNRYHDHALPQFDRPRPLVNLFGIENLAGIGIASSFLLPALTADVNSLELSVIRGGGGFAFTANGKYRLIYTADFKNFYDISSSNYFEWTLSGAVGKNDPDERYNTYVGDVGLTYKWTPEFRTRYRSFEWRTEFLLSKFETPASDIDSFGFYTSMVNRLNRRFVVGGRIGYSELPYDNSLHEWNYVVNLDFWQSEFVFVRLQYGLSDRNIILDNDTIPDDGTLLLQVVWAMGPHKHEAY